MEFDTWGSYVNVDLNDASCKGSNDINCYDIAQTKNLRRLSASRPELLRSKPQRREVADRRLWNRGYVPVEYGGACVHAMYINLDLNWTLFELPFEDFAQHGFGHVELADWSSSGVMFFNWQMPTSDEYDIVLDEVCFMARDGSISSPPTALTVVQRRNLKA